MKLDNLLWFATLVFGFAVGFMFGTMFGVSS